MNTTTPFQHVLGLVAVLSSAACIADAPLLTDDATPVPASMPGAERVVLTLEKRSGVSERGWSLDERRIVSSDNADLFIGSTDCGARGRWVNIQSADLHLCHDNGETCTTRWGVEVGGTDPDVALGDRILVERDGTPLGDLYLIRRTATPPDWYEQPDAPFIVELDFVPE